MKSQTWLSELFHFSLSCIGEGNGNLLQCSCLENPRDSGAWWAAIYGVAQSRTWLKRLSTSSYSSDGAWGREPQMCQGILWIIFELKFTWETVSIRRTLWPTLFPWNQGEKSSYGNASSLCWEDGGHPYHRRYGIWAWESLLSKLCYFINLPS